MLHKQGYSIIEIKELADTSKLEEGNFFYFDALVNGALQSGKIQSGDIFKAYRKLVEDLKYTVRYIYTDPRTPEEQKKIITAKVKDGYMLYLESKGQEVEQTFKKDLTIDEQEIQGFSPQLLKEIEKYSKIVDETISKVQNLIVKHHKVISPEQKSILERIELELTQIRGIRNTGKTQTTLEDVLKQIGAIELDLLKKGMVEEKQQFLSETNTLLKEVGSGDRITTEEQKKETVEYMVGSFFDRVKEFFSEKKIRPKKVEKIDTGSFVYFKNKRELDIYKKSLSKNTVDIIKSIFSFRFDQMKRLLLKRRLLSQNIQIIDNRLNNRNISYTRIIHGFGYYVTIFFSFIEMIAHLLAITLFFYIVAYLFITTGNSLGIISGELVGKSVFFLTLFSIFVFFLLCIRGWRSGVFFLILYIVCFSFLTLNF